MWLPACSAGADGTGGAAQGGAPTGGGAMGGGGGLSGGRGSGGVASCGNGTVDADEACDGDDFQGKTCADLDFDFGELVCDSLCQISTVGCRRHEKTTSRSRCEPPAATSRASSPAPTTARPPSISC